MQGDQKVDELMRPVLAAIKRHVKDREAATEIYNRAYEAVMNSMDVKTGKTYCAYCGAEYPLDDNAATQVSEHIKTCEKHPMRALEAELKKWRTGEIVGIEFVPKMFNELEKRAEAAEARIHGAEFWTNFVYPDGATPEEIQNELLDYHQYLEETAKVYDHITGGLVSKQNTMALEVISIYDEKVIGLEDRAEKAEERAEKAEMEISSLLAVIDNAVDCYFNDKGNIKDAMYALRGKVEPK